MPGKILVAPFMPDGTLLHDHMRWVAEDGSDFDIEGAAQEPAGEVGDAEGSGTQA